ncbi:MAG: hypothetical protein ACE5HD_06945 [Acidobacteriota bacterium]
MTEPLTVRVFGRRRHILINSPYQHRISLITTLLALLPPSIFFSIYYLISAAGSRRIVAASPGLEELVRGQDRTESLLILAAVLFYGLGVYLVTLLESHRTAGFLHRVNLRLKELQDGRYDGRLRPRQDDHFTFIADSLNDLSTALKAQTEADLSFLDDLSRNIDATLDSTASASHLAKDGLVELRGRIEALRALKQSHLHGGTAPSTLASVIQIDDQKPAASREETPSSDSLTS